MKLTRITKRLGRVIGLDNFSSVRFESEVEGLVEPNESFEEIDEKLFNLAARSLKADIRRWRESTKRKKTVGAQQSETKE